MQNTGNWATDIPDYIAGKLFKGESKMKMKSYAVTVEVSGTVTVFVTAPDYEEAEDCAIEEAQNMDLRECDLNYEVVCGEEDGDD